ncbi:hypothetical protein QEG98_20090 [Myxococcus sp. MxC21-1]|nr:hypothetical protein QEG98_20090 [Myxococcus sp. MxC21-1]
MDSSSVSGSTRGVSPSTWSSAERRWTWKMCSLNASASSASMSATSLSAPTRMGASPTTAGGAMGMRRSPITWKVTSGMKARVTGLTSGDDSRSSTASVPAASSRNCSPRPSSRAVSIKPL